MRKTAMLTVTTAAWLAVAITGAAEDRKLVLGMVAKSQSNPVFQAAYAGAKDAARELGPTYGVAVTIDWQTPPDEDAQKQAEAIELLARGGAQGILVSCSDANACTPAIDKAVALGAVAHTVGLLLDDRRRVALYVDAHRHAEVDGLFVGEAQLFGELVDAHVLCQVDFSLSSSARWGVGRSRGVDR